MDFVLICVFIVTATNVLECIESRSGRCVGVNVEDVSTLDLLEQSHCGVPLVIFHHDSVVLSFLDFVSWVLEDASRTIRALAGVIKEVLAYRCEVLSAQSLLLLKLFLSMGKATSLFLELVLALLAFQPEPTQFGLDLSLPSTLHLTVLLCQWGEWIELDGGRLLPLH